MIMNFLAVAVLSIAPLLLSEDATVIHVFSLQYLLCTMLVLETVRSLP